MTTEEFVTLLSTLTRAGQRVRTLNLALQHEDIKSVYQRCLVLDIITPDGRITARGELFLGDEYE